MEFKANCGVWGTMFGVPCVVADNFLKLATGEQIKVLLYLLRASGRSVSAEEIALNTGVTAQQAEEAVLFWQQVNVLSSDNTINVPKSIMTEGAPQQTNTVSVEETLLVNSSAMTRRRENLRPTEITDIMKDSPAVAELFKAAESILGHINNTMQNSLIWMTNYLGLKAEVILVLLVYCANIEKTNVAYIEKIAVSWAEKDINTLSVAQEEIERLTSSNDYVGSIMKMFEMKNRPTTKQLDIIEKWRAAGYAKDMIHYAYEKTLENTGKVSFAYTDKVLASWKESGFRSSDDVKRAESDFRKRKKSGTDTNETFDAEKYNFVINNF
ncbi:MAG: DnaD domain protein [Ruminococcus sp.]|nr:DnaD domain protein [Ruminococcus sp.]